MSTPRERQVDLAVKKADRIATWRCGWCGSKIMRDDRPGDSKSVVHSPVEGGFDEFGLPKTVYCTERCMDAGAGSMVDGHEYDLAP